MNLTININQVRNSMKSSLRKRVNKATQNAILLLTSYSTGISSERQATTVHAVSKRLRQEFMVGKSDKIIVTEVGFITMALLAGHAIYRRDLLLIPGVDEQNQFDGRNNDE